MNKYQRVLQGIVVDLYNFLDIYSVTCPAIAHAVKKLMMPGERGHKGKLQDLQEAHASIGRAIELERERQPAEAKIPTIIPLIAGAIALLVSTILLNTKTKHQ